jgi:hypothetical protein
MYGSEIWSPTLREEHTLTICGNMLLRRVFETKREGTEEHCIMRNFRISN